MKYINTYADLAAYTADATNRGTTKSTVSKINDGTGLKYFGVNIVMPKEFAGVGDTVVYDTLDSTVKVIKLDTCVVASKPANLLIVGVVFFRTEDKVWLVGLSQAAKAYKTENTATPLIDYNGIRRMNGVETYYCAGNLARFIEYYGANGSATPSATEPVDPLSTTGFNGSSALVAKYGTYANYCASNLPKYPYSKLAIIDDDGKTNTAIITALGTPALYPAFDYAATYTITNAVGFTSGNWWLPSFKELYYLIKDVNLATTDALNRGIASSGGTAVTPYAYYWSSAEYSVSDAWLYSNGGYMDFHYKYRVFTVRVVSAFTL